MRAFLLLALVGFCRSMTTGPRPTSISVDMVTLPVSGAELDKLVAESFKNVDNDKDGFIERYEFDTLVIIADSDNDGCMTLDEYKSFSAGTPEIATKIYKHFDPDNTNCITVDKVASQFALMDADGNSKVTLQEFENYYVQLLKLLFSSSAPVG